MSDVDIIKEIGSLERNLISLLVSKHLLLYANVPSAADEHVQIKIVETINQINAYYVLLNSKK